jgi:hypothetical protein
MFAAMHESGCWPISTFLSVAAFGCYRGIADIDQAAPIKLGTRPKLPEADPGDLVILQRTAQNMTAWLRDLSDSRLQQLRQLGDVDGDAPRFVTRQQLGRRPSGSSSQYTKANACPLTSRTMKHGAVSSTDRGGRKRRPSTAAGMSRLRAAAPCATRSRPRPCPAGPRPRAGAIQPVGARRT